MKIVTLGKLLLKRVIFVLCKYGKELPCESAEQGRCNVILCVI